MARLHRSDFLASTKAAFPELRDRLNQEHGLLHMEMHVFRAFIQDAIESQDHATVIKAFQLCDQFLQGGNSNLVNAVAVSLLEHLNLEDGKVPRAWAHALMPTAVSEQHAAIVEYNQQFLAKQHRR